MKADDLKTQLYEGDTLILGKQQNQIFQKCCGCGLWHEINIKRMPDGRLEMAFHQTEEPELGASQTETIVRKGK